jgi:hypothetical protein
LATGLAAVCLLVLAGPEALMKEAGLSPDDIRDVSRGRVVARVLDSNDNAEVLSAAALRVRAPVSALARLLREPRDLLAGTDGLGNGPARVPADFAALTLDRRDLQDLRRCRVGDCSFRLSRPAIERLGKEVDWHAADAPERAAQLIRDLLAAYAADYAQRGQAALMVYADDRAPAPVAHSLDKLREAFPAASPLAPALFAHLQSFPEKPLAEATDVILWQRDRFWRKEVVSLQHRVVREEPARVVAASQQLWANHFFEAALGACVAVESEGYTWLVIVDRSRADVRPGGFNLFERILIRRFVRARLKEQLEHLRSALEGATPAGPRPASPSPTPPPSGP